MSRRGCGWIKKSKICLCSYWIPPNLKFVFMAYNLITRQEFYQKCWGKLLNIVLLIVISNVLKICPWFSSCFFKILNFYVFQARHYSVVPLGPRSGLIQWVEGAVPMFSMYKKWTQRQQNILEMSSKKDRDALKTVTQKPADQYYR